MKRHTEYLAMVKDAARAVADERRRHAGTQGYRGNEERGLEMALRAATSAGFGPDARAAVRAILRDAPTVPVSPGVKWQRDAQRAKRRASGRAMYPAIRNPDADGYYSLSEMHARGVGRPGDMYRAPAKVWTITVAPSPGQRVRAKRIVSVWNGTMVGNVATFETADDARLAAFYMDDEGIKWTRSNPRRRNPARPDDDVTRPYPFAKKEGEYSQWSGVDAATLREWRDQAMRDRDEWSKTANASQSVEDRAQTALRAAEKAHAAAAKQAQHDYAVYGWHADDTITIAQERKRRKERAESRKDDVRDEIAALSNPRRRNPHERWFSGSGPRPALYRFTQRFLTGPLAGKVITDTDDLPKMVGAVHETANGGTYRIESCEKIGAAKSNPRRRRNPSPEIHSEGLPARAPRGYVRIYTVPGDDMMATPTRRFDNIVDAVVHARRVGRHVFVDDVSKERARRYGVV